jgi:phosphatidate phosphatase PAH1
MKQTEQKIATWQKKHSGLSPEAQRKIDRLVKEYEKTRKIGNAQDRTLNLTSGIRLIREFKGDKHEVTTLERGFEYKGRFYKSLSAIANEITGTRWNGKVFFGVAKETK